MRTFAQGVKFFTLGLLTLAIGACTMRPAVTTYEAETPQLTTAFFTGKTTAHGLVEDWRGKVIRRFTATIEGKFDAENRGTLTEVFYWNDGEVQERTWQLTPTGPGTFKGTAGDVVGDALGQASGNAINMRYKLAVPLGGKGGSKGKPMVVNLDMDDWMYLLPDGTLLNLTDMKKFGFTVGRLVIFIQPATKKP